MLKKEFLGLLFTALISRTLSSEHPNTTLQSNEAISVLSNKTQDLGEKIEDNDRTLDGPSSLPKEKSFSLPKGETNPDKVKKDKAVVKTRPARFLLSKDHLKSYKGRKKQRRLNNELPVDKKRLTYRFNPNQNFVMDEDRIVNPQFDYSIHNEELNYLHFRLPKPTIVKFKIDMVYQFLIDWMKPRSFEEIKLKPMAIEGQTVVNRFTCNYFNKLKNKAKVYFVEIDFSDRKDDKSDYIAKANVADLIDADDPDYDLVYDHTLRMDCESIEARFYDPNKITCVPVVNNDSYVLSHLYNVKMTFRVHGVEHKRERLVYVTSTLKKKAQPLTPKPRRKFELKVKTPNELIKNRLRLIKTGVPNRLFYSMLKSHSLQKKAREIMKEANELESDFTVRMMKVEKSYQEQLKSMLSNQLAEANKQNDAIENTYNLMRGTVDKINAFNIKTAILFMQRRLDNMMKFKAYKKLSRHYRKEVVYDRMFDHLNYLRYLHDRKLDMDIEKIVNKNNLKN